MSKSREVEQADDSFELAHYVVGAAQREMAEKAREHVPALSLGAVAGGLGMLSAAASYRLGVLLLEKRLPPEAAAFVTAATFGGGAALAGVAARRRWRGARAPLPTETARQVVEVIADAAK
ncbi:phage holin family protein [Actinomadura fulvescens]|uniref:Superfamily III holin-X n=1 Tax=Actinomadura fulvescens TaxID=46160 RepID=A0ABP6C3B6_9ACTN